MKFQSLFFSLVLAVISSQGQTSLAPLTVEKIMRDPKWMGSSPSRLQWDNKSQQLFFSWNPDGAVSDSTYFISIGNQEPQKTTWRQRLSTIFDDECIYNLKRSYFVYEKDGDIFLVNAKSGEERQISNTTESESNPSFSFGDSKIIYIRNRNLFGWDIHSGMTSQLTNFHSTATTSTAAVPGGFQRGASRLATGALTNPQEKWLSNEALENSTVLQERKHQRSLRDSMQELLPKENKLRSIEIGDKSVVGLGISPDGRYVHYRLIERNGSGRSTVIPNYVTESGFTEEVPGRTKVGAPESKSEFYIFDRQNDTVLKLDMSKLPGIKDIPQFYKDYPQEYKKKQKDSADREVDVFTATWSPAGSHLVLNIYSKDNKDRWIMLVDPASGRMTLLDRQHDEAWIGGPGIIGFGAASVGWTDEHNYWFQSEVTGYSHLYTINVNSLEKKALTNGQYEVQGVQLSNDRKFFYITTNEVHPGEQQFYKLPVGGGIAERLTALTGANLVTLSPDEKWLGILYSYTNKPWELYLQPNKPGAKAQQVTRKSQSAEFSSYPWRDAEVISFKASDGAMVYARLYRPSNPHPSKPAVIFVHGAGYLQNAHKWWSSYFREYMFNNLLADNGYTVLDIDYRGSAGYGRDWRTAIYRHMGGKDLSDQVDGAKFLVEKYGINPQHIGIYGGSYGGFITLMAMFKEPEVFSAGAGLRSVTDWAHYNHGYTSNILNEPFTDSIAYRQSSPIFFANGLKGHLLMCHGMVDLNVHFQDIVRLTERLIELGKENWELAVYPMEDHGFVEPVSWTDEYKRIFRLFELNLK